MEEQNVAIQVHGPHRHGHDSPAPGTANGLPHGQVRTARELLDELETSLVRTT
jgi:hypothetical protein